MDLSALIFVALAVAWAVYLIPKALKHHEEVSRSRTVEVFSSSMRVLARREAVSAKDARLVRTPGRPARRVAESVEVRVETSAGAAPEASEVSGATGDAVRRATRRRRRVLALVVLAIAVVAGLAGAGRVAWPWVAVPVGVLLAWLVACRLMVRRERGLARGSRRTRRGTREQDPWEGYEPIGPLQSPAEDAAVKDPTEEIAAVVASAAGSVRSAAEEGVWDPLPMQLPTYVGKEPAARRTVRTIDLDSTGVWTSGRTEVDAALAREADEAERSRKATAASEKAERERRTGSDG